MTRLTTISILLYAHSSFAAVWFVDKDNTGPQDGTSWTTAFTTIQPAIDAAFADGGGEVWVADGTYDEGRVSMLHSPPVDTGSLVLRENVLSFGGFVGNETMRDQRDFVSNITVIDGSTSRSGSPAFHVIFGADNAVVDGFTVTGGASGSGLPIETQSGGGLRNESSPMTVRNCNFVNNNSDSGSGGAIISAPGLTIESCSFLNNSAERGGAVSASGSIFDDCRFEGNFASVRAGAVQGSVELNGCIFIDNEAGVGGAVVGSVVATSCVFRGNRDTSTSNANGGAVSLGSEGQFVNCIFEGNSSNDRPAAIGAIGTIGMDGSSNTNIEIMNCTFWNNTAGPGGAAVHLTGVDGFIRNSIFWNNSPHQIAHLNPGATLIMFNDVQGGQMIFGGIPLDLDEGGNIDAEPFFVDPDNGDFRVFTGSPVIDAGTAAGAPATDIAGIPRPQGAGFDMGAHESDGSLPSIPAAQTAALITLTALLMAIPVVLLWKRHTGTP